MRNKKFIIPIIIVVLVAIVVVLVFLVHNSNKNKEAEPYNFNFKIPEQPYGFQWGMSMEEVDDKLLENGLFKKRQLINSIICYDYDYLNITDLTVKVYFIFNDDRQLTDIRFHFDFSDASIYYAEEGFYPEEGFDFTTNELLVAYKNELNNMFGEGIPNPEDIDHTFWVVEDMIIDLYDVSENSFYVSYKDAESYPDIVSKLKLLK